MAHLVALAQFLLALQNKGHQCGAQMLAH